MQAAGFAVLGPLALVLDDGQVVAAGGPKQRELLGLLLLHRGTPLSQDRLVDSLWDGRPPDGAEVTLRSHVSHLRRRLAESVPESRVETGPLGYALVTGAAAVDADQFQELLGRGQEAFGLERLDEAADLLGRALELWRGPPWSGLEHVDAAVADAARLEELRLVAHEVLLAAELDRGRHREVVAEAEGLHARHPFRERFAGQLMLALYRSGRQADALEVYAATRERLAEELGLDPGPELQALSQSILRQDPSLAGEPAPRTGTRAARPRPVSDGVLAALATAPLDGRAAERQRLRDTWRTVVDDGAPRLVLVSGESGIGKSRLLADLVEKAAADGATLMVGRCDGTDAAYHPIADALRSSTMAQALLTPPLEQIVGTAPTPVADPGSGDAQPPAYAAMRTLLDRLAHEGPALVVVEDAEGIDRASARLLRHLAARLPQGAALVVAYRDPPGGRHPALLELLGDVGLRALTEQLVLGPLDERSTADLARRWVPELDDAGVRRLWEHTGGNPYFAVEVVRSWAGADQPLGVPPALRDVLVQRLGTLSAAGRTTLAAAAALGRSVDLALLAHVVGDDSELTAHLEEAVTAGFLVEAGGAWSAGWAFPHELMREATARDLSGAARMRLHRRAADALAARSATVSGRAAMVVRHLRAAGHLASPDEAADWCLRAAREAAGLHAWDEAIEHAENAVEILAGLPDRAAYAAAAEETARLRIRGSRGFDRIVALREAALEVRVQTGDAAEIGRAHSRLGAALSLQHSVLDVPRALEHLDAAERMLGADVVTAVHAGRTQVAMFGVRTDLLEAASAAVARDAERRTRPDLAVAAAWARGWALFNRGRLAEGDANDEAAWRAAQELGDPYLGWTAAQAPAIRHTIYLLDPRAGRAWCRRGLGQPRFAALGHSHDTIVDQLGVALLTTGDLDGARDVVASLPVTSLSRRLLRLREGRLQDAADEWAEAIAADESAGDLHDAAINSLWLAEAREHLGDVAGAVQCLRRAAEIGAAGPQVPMELAARAELARLLAADDRDAAAAELTRCTAILAGGEDYRGRAGRVRLAEAVLHAARGEAEAAARALEAARTVCEALGLPWGQFHPASTPLPQGSGTVLP